jgi:hypothetical protein
MNAVGTMTINPTTNYISMDEDGDGVSDATVSPTSVLSGNQANDVIPPITTATVNGTTVTLSATDDNSGVLNTSYSIDGTNWNIYKEPFQAAAGTTVQFLSMDKAGNVEDVKQIVVSKPSDTTMSTDTDNQTPSTENNNNYYYDDNTPPSNDVGDSQSNDNDDTALQNPANQNMPLDATQTPDTMASSSNEPIIPTDTLSLEKLPTQDDNNTLSGSIAETNNPLEQSKKMALPKALLAASVNGVVPSGNILILLIIGLSCIILAVIVKKRWSKKKSQD